MNAIDTNDAQQVSAQRMVSMPLAEALDLVPKQQPLIPSTGSWFFTPEISWIDANERTQLTVTDRVAKCPDCGETTMYWDSNTPDEMSCANCAVVLPRDYPANASLELDS